MRVYLPAAVNVSDSLITAENDFTPATLTSQAPLPTLYTVLTGRALQSARPHGVSVALWRRPSRLGHAGATARVARCRAIRASRAQPGGESEHARLSGRRPISADRRPADGHRRTCRERAAWQPLSDPAGGDG